MPAAKTPAEADKLPGSPHDSAPKAARERRESERVITDWEQETTQLGRALALMTLDVSAIPSEKWAHRFIISLPSGSRRLCFAFLRSQICRSDGIAREA